VPISFRLAIIPFFLLAACRPPRTIVYQLESRPQLVGCDPADCGERGRQIVVTYLGVSGLLISHQDHVILTAPFFSNPPISRVVPLPTHLLRGGSRVISDGRAIERLLPKSADRATAILVGHGHYDHLMDIPYIATRRSTAARIFGGASVRHMLMGDSTLRANGTRVVAIDSSEAAAGDRPGKWFYTSDRAYRFMAIVAGHAPAYNLWRKGFTFAGGKVSSDLDSLPRTASGWKLGEPYAFIIDVLDQATGEVVFRIYFQDAPSEPPLGIPPRKLLLDHGVDLAVLCVATSSNVHASPDSLLSVLQPSNVMITHWESFFRSQTLPPEVSRASDLDAFVGSLARTLPLTSGWVMPLAQATYSFRPVPRR